MQNNRTYKRLIPFLFLAFATIQLHGQEVEIIDPCTPQTIEPQNQSFFHGRGKGSGYISEEKNKFFAYYMALRELRENIFMQIKYAGIKVSIEGSEDDKRFYEYRKDAHWMEYLNSRVEILCEDTKKYPDEFCEAFCLVQLRQQSIKSILADFHSWLKKNYDWPINISF